MGSFIKDGGWVTDSRFEIRDFSFPTPTPYRLSEDYLESRNPKLESYSQS